MAAFPRESLTSSTSMPIINQINCKLAGKIETYIFALSILAESLLIDNQWVFQDLNVIQLGINETNTWWNELLMIWWKEQKTEVQLWDIQANEIGIDWFYDRYQHIFTGLTF